MAITGFRHKGLGAFFTTGSTRGIQAKHAARLRLLLGALHTATQPRDLAAPGWGLHPLKGDRGGSWALKVSGNWRVIFRFTGQGVTDVDYDDYH